jgi:hypothetical protein
MDIAEFTATVLHIGLLSVAWDLHTDDPEDFIMDLILSKW